MVARKFSNAQAAEALKKHYGNVSAAARAMNVDHSTLFNRLKKNKKLREVRELAGEQMVDLAESGLWKLVQDRNLGAICFALKCKGKERGWVEKPQEQALHGSDEKEQSTEFINDD